MNYVFEIGANRGQHTRALRERYPNCFMVVFEPIMTLANDRLNELRAYPDIIINSMAVDIENSIKTFNLAENADWGCSSLYNFREHIHEIWPGRPDFNMTSKYNVVCIRLDTYIDTFLPKEQPLDEIEYIHIDAQGNDFRVLQSLGNYIHKVQKGVCEVAKKICLYDNDYNHIDYAKPWLESHGFKVTVKDDSLGNEADLHFER